MSKVAYDEVEVPVSTVPELLEPAPFTASRNRRSAIGLHVISVLAALGISAAVVAVTGHSPAAVFSDLFDGSVRGWGSLGTTLDDATPLILVAAGTIVAVRAGQFNIGQEGQLTIGATAAGLVAFKVHGPGPLVLILALLAAVAGGAAWAGVVAVLRFWRGVDVVISSLLLVFVAEQILEYTINDESLLQQPPVAGQPSASQSSLLSPHVRLPSIGHYPGLDFESGLILAVVLALAASVCIGWTSWGFKLKTLGRNAQMAKRIGISAAVLGGTAIAISGGFAGLAGGVMFTGQAYRLTPDFSSNFGFNGMLVALVARNNAFGAIGVALLFGAINAGGGFLATANVSSDIVNVVQALLILALVFPPAFEQFRKYRQARRTSRRGIATGVAR